MEQFKIYLLFRRREKSLPYASLHLSRKSLPPPLSRQAIQTKSFLLFPQPLLYPEGKAS
jgi:hypothetical protein